MDNLEGLAVLGAILIAIIVLAIPVLFVCSFIYAWGVFLKLMLAIAVLFDFAFIVSAIMTFED